MVQDAKDTEQCSDAQSGFALGHLPADRIDIREIYIIRDHGYTCIGPMSFVWRY